MRGMVMRAATGLLAALLLTSTMHMPAAAQPLSPVKVEEAQVLAREFLTKIGMDKKMDEILLSSRGVTIAVLVQQGKTEAQAAAICDQYMMPEFRARAPELLRRFEDVMVKDFTVPELRAIVNGEDNDARRSAQAKAGQMPAHFAAAGQEWGGMVGVDVFTKNRAAFEKLGLNEKGITQ